VYWEGMAIPTMLSTSIEIKKTQKYVQGDTITTTRDMVESSDSEIDDFLTPSQMFKNLAV